jgi:tRNA(fMet)-specific endonuclease VapC
MLDTDISSYIMKRSHDKVLRKLQRFAVSAVCISAITKSELMYGVEVSPRRQKDQAALDVFLRHVQALDFPEGAALDYASIRADLKALGTMIGANDLLIAAHARSLGLTLVTNNTREFGRVKQLKVENWT